MQTEGLSKNGVALVEIQLSHLLFGGYLIGLDQFHYNHLENALTVFVIYAIDPSVLRRTTPCESLNKCWFGKGFSGGRRWLDRKVRRDTT